MKKNSFFEQLFYLLRLFLVFLTIRCQDKGIKGIVVALKMSRQIFVVLFAVFVLSLVPKIFSTLTDHHQEYYLTDTSFEVVDETFNFLNVELGDVHVFRNPALLLLGVLCLNNFSPSHHFTERYNLPPP